MGKQEKKYEQQANATGESINPYHRPVLLNEAIEGMNIQDDGIYVDCTFGGGGHSNEILKRLGKRGKLFAFDQDANAAINLPADGRIVFVPHNFRHLQRFLRLHKTTKVDGILADLGVSSHQFDEADRGFSIRFDGDLDMRMDKRQSLTAFEVVSNYSELQLHKLFEHYGEVTNARTLAKTIVHVRNTASLKTIQNFKSTLGAMVKGNPNKYFAQVFQALRIEVNDELGALKEMLGQTTDVLKHGGRIAVITFHSLEDRIVKNFFKKGSFTEEDQTNPFAQSTIEPALQAVTKKPITPSAEELKENPRSRSAKLRIAERLPN
ncbi:MAG TPA: 16S rRNA (cytosine(1402)-N(4))-methyltransferase RsmH [Puia sp.]|jgi:16S rRNA (cytosine1402-N4)-methyltransferase|nr:16S rRNA (cytosine(1402)-N(4))-methyltransferase RsmH [Puia sp.]